MKVPPSDLIVRWLTRTGFTYRQFGALVGRDEKTIARQIHHHYGTPKSLALWLQRLTAIEITEDHVIIKLKRITEPYK